MANAQITAPAHARETGPDLLTVAELADLLRSPVSYVYRLRHERRGPRSVKVGGRVLYRRADIDAWLDQHADDDRA